MVLLGILVFLISYKYSHSKILHSKKKARPKPIISPQSMYACWSNIAAIDKLYFGHNYTNKPYYPYFNYLRNYCCEKFSWYFFLEFMCFLRILFGLTALVYLIVWHIYTKKNYVKSTTQLAVKWGNCQYLLAFDSVY